MRASLTSVVENPFRPPTVPDIGDVHLYLARYGSVENEANAELCRALLSVEERVQEERFFFPEDRRRYLMTRALVRTVLSRYGALEPREWRFGANRWGKPEIANPDPSSEGIRFNVSHTRGLIVLAVGQRRAIGVDVENYLVREAVLGVAEHHFARKEVCALREIATADLQEHFFTLWTLKEAYIKARGMGLSLPLDKFCFQFAGADSISLELSAELGDDPKRWQISLFRPAAGYLLSLCAERQAECNVVARWTEPFGIDEPASLQLLRNSH